MIFHWRLQRSWTANVMAAKNRRTKTKPSPFWSASRPWSTEQRQIIGRCFSSVGYLLSLAGFWSTDPVIHLRSTFLKHYVFNGFIKTYLPFLFHSADENSALALENESQREQYERCLDEVGSLFQPQAENAGMNANINLDAEKDSASYFSSLTVVSLENNYHGKQTTYAFWSCYFTSVLTFYSTWNIRADLREECLKLRTRVFDLEQQNRALGVLFQQRIKPASDLLLQ
ncbi:hypothetical protein GOODEAATRI_020621, partial [Goodea atripinnis]